MEPKKAERKNQSSKNNTIPSTRITTIKKICRKRFESIVLLVILMPILHENKQYRIIRINQVAQSSIHQTVTVFHLPFLNKIKAAIAIAVSATGIEIKTPVGPNSKYFASRKASGI